MTGTTIYKPSNVAFEKKLNGYDKQQVDRYITALSEAYQTAYKEYNSIKRRYDELLREYDLMEKQKSLSGREQENIGKILADEYITNFLLKVQQMVDNDIYGKHYGACVRHTPQKKS